jgi:hypothetical protein
MATPSQIEKTYNSHLYFREYRWNLVLLAPTRDPKPLYLEYWTGGDYRLTSVTNA